MTELMRVTSLTKHFPVKRGLLRRVKGFVRAVDGVDLSLSKGETFALVGESGSGKTTLGRCMIRLIEPTSGDVSFDGESLMSLPAKELRKRRRHFQLIFQDPYGSLNPRMRVAKILAEPLEVHAVVAKHERRARVLELLGLVGLSERDADRFPHEFSGGQRQRIGIARALATEPQLVIADEPVSALDVSVRAQIINLLSDLKEKFGLTLMIIAHDLAVVEQISDRVGVLYFGRLVELGPTAEVFAGPSHPYTVSLLSAVPVADPGGRRERIILPGEPPSHLDPPTGCPFHPRCPIARERCASEEPALEELGPGRTVACHYPNELEPPKVKADGTF